MTEAQTAKLKELRAKKTEELDTNETALLDSLVSLETAEKKTETTEERMSGMQTQMEKWGTEMGTMRTDLAEALKETGKQKPPKKAGEDDKEKEAQAEKDKAEALKLQNELSSTEEGKKVLEDAWKKMTPEQQAKMGTDTDFRLQVYRAAQTLLPDPPPKMPWDTSEADDKDGKSEAQKLFTDEGQHRQAPGKKRTPGTPPKKGEPVDETYTEDELVEDDRVR